MSLSIHRGRWCLVFLTSRPSGPASPKICAAARRSRPLGARRTARAVAAPERRVVALVGDGSAHYAIQALWTQAREGLDVVTVVMNNAKYQILELELAIQGVACASKTLTNLGDPRVDFVKLAEGYGVRAFRAETTGSFRRAFSRALEEKGPTLIDAVLSNE